MTEAFKHPDELSLAYFEASVVVEHLVELKGDEGLRTLLKAYADGATTPTRSPRRSARASTTWTQSYKAFVEQHYGKLRDAMEQAGAQRCDPGDLAGLRARATAAPGNFVSQVSYGQALFKRQ